MAPTRSSVSKSTYKATSRDINHHPYPKAGVIELEDAFQYLQITSNVSLPVTPEQSSKDIQEISLQPTTASPTATHAKHEIVSKYSPISKSPSQMKKSRKSVKFDPAVDAAFPREDDKERCRKSTLKEVPKQVMAPASLPIITPLNEDSISKMFDECMRLTQSPTISGMAELQAAFDQTTWFQEQPNHTGADLSDSSTLSDALDLWSSSSAPMSPLSLDPTPPSTPPSRSFSPSVFYEIPKTPVRTNKSSGKTVSQKSIAKAAKKPYNTDKSGRKRRSCSPPASEDVAWENIIPSVIEKPTPSSPTRVPFGSSNSTLHLELGEITWPSIIEDNFWASALDKTSRYDVFSLSMFDPQNRPAEDGYWQVMGAPSLGPPYFEPNRWSEEVSYSSWVY
ncbi:hypothetical protein FRC19_003381 [Serendipita sp. 401]|nr:hypothetical protein FRC15_002126 [Serendipita sp. 397]KAG8784963.1 hypothetical protein FRC16_002084 [Serendipita sp. 398]KAG8812102.1 hypothetical protein FRC19_003381 [Serendipita sp. 401]KAG8849896.1 hypothetical protein FRC20_002162 [Serendipita sp. 405]KAG9049365.1 hypothetical protein FS842_000202 [Serendipita sp. 407]